MPHKYFPVLRARQQEIDVLEKFDFGNSMIPIVEIIKQKARTNQLADGHAAYADLFARIQSEKVLVDLPIYLDPTVSTAKEVRTFFLSTISNLDARIAYYGHFAAQAQKVVPVISILQPHSDEASTLVRQFTALSPTFPQIAVRVYINKFDETLNELGQIQLRENDIIIYDLHTTDITNPLVKIHKKRLDEHWAAIFKVIIRSAINTEVQNVRLQHGEIVTEANNSLLELFNTGMYKFLSFGDFAGVKKDDITSGGTISPGFIFFNPDENIYYGFKGNTKSLSEFEDTIVPAVLNSPMVRAWVAAASPYINNNPGYDRLVAISNRVESGRNQAKFKWIAIMHYLHCLKTMIANGVIN